MTGKISRVVAERGFGFITGEDGQDYFFHRRAFDRDLDPLVQGLQVTFSVSRGPEGASGDGAMRRIEAPARWRKPPVPATPRLYSHRADSRLYRGMGSIATT